MYKTRGGGTGEQGSDVNIDEADDVADNVFVDLVDVKNDKDGVNYNINDDENDDVIDVFDNG